jgi:hypothetical protein
MTTATQEPRDYSGVAIALYDLAAEWQLPQPNIWFQGSQLYLTAENTADVSLWATALGFTLDGSMASGVWRDWRIAVSAS